MIIKAKTRNNAVALGRYLLDGHKNDHVEIFSVHGWVSEDVMGAMRELDAMSQGVKSEHPIFSVVFSPPAHEQPSLDVYEAAMQQVKERCGLTDQPHMMIFHESNGRRHMHGVISRVDSEHGRVIPLPFFKQKLTELSKEIYLEQGWDLPKGFIDRRNRDPRSYDLATYHQAKREGIDPKQLKSLTQEAWAVTKGKDQAAFMAELEKRGLYLAKGDTRSHTIMTWQGQIYSLPKLLDRKTKEVRERLGSGEGLRSVDDTRAYIRDTLEPVMGKMKEQADAHLARDMVGLDAQRQSMKAQHQQERQKLDTGQKTRQDGEGRERAERLRKGLGGLWDRLTGRYKQLKAQNDKEAYEALQRDRQQRQAIINAQLAERQALQRQIVEKRQRHAAQILELHRDLHTLRHPPQKQTRTQQAEPAKEPSARAEWLKQQQERGPETSKPASRAEWLREQQQRKPTERDTDRGRDLDR